MNHRTLEKASQAWNPVDSFRVSAWLRWTKEQDFSGATRYPSAAQTEPLLGVR